jgi:hypothetical protein
LDRFLATLSLDHRLISLFLIEDHGGVVRQDHTVIASYDPGVDSPHAAIVPIECKQSVCFRSGVTHMNRIYQIPSRRLLGVFILYSIVSTLLFLFTAGGWTAIMGMLFNVLFYTGCCVTLAVNIAWLGRRNIHTLPLPARFLMGLAAVQGFISLFNYGDCGDASGSFLFLQRVLTDQPWWVMCRESHAWFPFPVMLFAYLTYYGLIGTGLSLLVNGGDAQARPKVLP